MDIYLALLTGSNNPIAHSISASENNLELLQLNLGANSTEAINISSISFDTNGTADESTDIDSVRLFMDVNENGIYDISYDNQIGTTLTSFTNNGLITFSGIDETIDVNSDEGRHLVFDLAGSVKLTRR